MNATRMPFLTRSSLAALAGLLAAASLAAPAQAVSFTVGSTADQGDELPGDGICASDSFGCTLRAAVEEVNRLIAAGSHSIVVPAGKYQLTLAAGGALEIANDVSISGAGARSTTIAQEASSPGDRVFDVVGDHGVTLARMTITGGVAHSGNGFFGGNVRSAGRLRLVATALTSGSGDSAGAVANTGGTLTVLDSTLTGNRAPTSPFEGGDAGAILNFGGAAPALLEVQNSTIVSNSARLAGGILSYNHPENAVRITNSTITSNSSGDRGGAAGIEVGSGSAILTNTILADNRNGSVVDNCGAAQGASLASGGGNLQDNDDCPSDAPGDQAGADPLLGDLADNGGETDTRALLSGSPALDAGVAAACPSTDQRGAPRPQGGGCDVGAYERAVLAAFTGDAVAVALTAAVLTGVIRPEGPPVAYRFQYGTTPAYGSETAAAQTAAGLGFKPVSAHVGGLQPGTTYHYRLVAGSAAGADRTFTTPAAEPPVEAPAEPKRLADLPPPVAGKVANAEPAKGIVLVATPARSSSAGAATAAQKGLRFVPLREARQIPIGSFFDTRKGRVRLQTAANRLGRRQTGEFESGLFQVLQSRKRSAKGLTELRLKGSSFRSCRRAGHASDEASATRHGRRRIRRLRGNARGRFRTRGRYSAATVRGTIWDVSDRCDGTLTKVTRGNVAVRDFRRRKNILLRAGKSYLARAPR